MNVFFFNNRMVFIGKKKEVIDKLKEVAHVSTNMKKLIKEKATNTIRKQ